MKLPFLKGSDKQQETMTTPSQQPKFLKPTRVQNIAGRFARLFRRKPKMTPSRKLRLPPVPPFTLSSSTFSSSSSIVSQPSDAAPGSPDYQILEELYTLKETIGEGSFGKVKKAIHKSTREYVAIKIIKKARVGREIPRVRREVRALITLDHPYISKLYQILETENNLFIVMEYCENGDLYDFICRKKKVKEEKSKKIFRQIASAVDYVHKKGIAHRDLKPENILLDENGDIRLIDFNLSATMAADYLMTHCGTMEYAAPELIRGVAYDGKKSDAWSLGVVLYVLLCGGFPFEEPKMREKIKESCYYKPKHLSTASADLISRLLTVDPKKRLSLEDLLNDSWLTPKVSGKRLSKCPKIIPPVECHNRKELDEEILTLMADRMNLPIEDLRTCISKLNFDNNVKATYLILVRKKQSMGSSAFVKKFSGWNPQGTAWRSIITPVRPVIDSNRK